MNDQPQQIDPRTITDLELAELLAQQQTTAYQALSAVAILQAELQRRKQLVNEKELEAIK
jgi:hypothetical protein